MAIVPSGGAPLKMVWIEESLSAMVHWSAEPLFLSMSCIRDRTCHASFSILREVSRLRAENLKRMESLRQLGRENMYLVKLISAQGLLLKWEPVPNLSMHGDLASVISMWIIGRDSGPILHGITISSALFSFDIKASDMVLTPDSLPVVAEQLLKSELELAAFIGVKITQRNTIHRRLYAHFMNY